MSPSIGIQTQIENWLSSWQFNGNPFGIWEASSEPNLIDYYIPHPFYEQLLTTQQSSLVYAPRGGGKTATLLMLQSQCRPQNVNSTIFSVSFNNFSDLIDTYYEHRKLLFGDYIKPLIDKTLIPLLVSLAYQVADYRFLNDGILSQSGYWIREYSPHILDEKYFPYLLERASSIVSSENIPKETIKKWSGSLLGNSKNKLATPPFWDAFYQLWLKIKQAPVSEPLSLQFEKFAPLKIWQYFIDFVITSLSQNRHSCDYFYLLVDGIDEYPLTQQDPIESGRVLEPLLGNLDFLQKTIGFAAKFFLPSEQRNGIKRFVREDRISVYQLSWEETSKKNDDKELIRKLLRQRIKTFNRTGMESLSALCEESSFRRFIEDDLLSEAGYSPRNVIRLGNQIFVEHCKNNPAPYSLITTTDWQNALQNYRLSIDYVPYQSTQYYTLGKKEDEGKEEFLLVNLQQKRVFMGGNEIEFSEHEFDLIKILYQRRGDLCSAEELIEELYLQAPTRKANARLRRLISRVRSKIEIEPNNPIIIKGIRNRGYFLDNFR